MELFKIGFITITLIDILDIIIVTYIFYKLYLVMRGTIASQIFLGLTLIILASLIAQTFNMRSLGWIFSRLTDIWRSEEHTSELQSQSNLVCRLLFEKKNSH